MSRNFTSPAQMQQFLEARTTRQSVFHWPWTTKPPTTALPPSRTSAVTVDGEEFEVQSQFGPVGVNNAKALLRNTTKTPSNQPYETRRVGPTPLPDFQTPLPPDRVDLPTFRHQVRSWHNHIFTLCFRSMDRTGIWTKRCRSKG